MKGDLLFALGLMSFLVFIVLSIAPALHFLRSWFVYWGVTI